MARSGEKATPARAAAGKKAAVTKVTPKSAAAKKAAATRATPKRAPATKATPKQASATKAAAKKPALAKKATTAKKATATKATAPKTTATKAATKTATKATAKRTATRKATAKATEKATPKATQPRKAVAKKAARKTAPTKQAATTAKSVAGSAPEPTAGAGGTVGPGGTAPEALAVRADESPWTAEELEAVRAELMEEAERLRAEIQVAESELQVLLRDYGEGAGEDQADAGTKTFERAQEMSLANNSRDMLLQAERALARIADGSYGICESCGNPIGKARLQAFPRATLCVTCKQREERR
jgi:RNA polymerase-binding transcription factor